MKTLLLTTPQAQFKAKTIRNFASKNLAGWQVEALSPQSLAQTTIAPDVMVVDVPEATKPAEIKAMMPKLAHLQTTYPQGSYVVFALKQKAQRALQQVANAQQRQVQAILSAIADGLQEFSHPERVDYSILETAPDLVAKLRLIEAKLKAAPPRPSPLDQVHEVVSATEDLRVANGNLSAAAIASAFGISINQLAGWLGRSRQALCKTPDADSLQDDLAFFEHVARLRAVAAPEAFLKWLRMRNAQLDNKTPLELLASGERQVVVDLVDDMLTGAPV